MNGIDLLSRKQHMYKLLRFFSNYRISNGPLNWRKKNSREEQGEKWLNRHEIVLFDNIVGNDVDV